MNMFNKLATTALVTGALMFGAFSAQAADSAKYEALSKEVIQAVVAEDTSNIDGLIAKLEEAASIGVEMANEIAAKDAKGKPLLDFLVSNLDKIKGASLEAIEHDWHHGHAFKDAGIEHDSFDHYGAVIGAKDAVIHPLTALVALKEYKKDADSGHLEQAQAELEEILGQLKYVK